MHSSWFIRENIFPIVEGLTVASLFLSLSLSLSLLFLLFSPVFHATSVFPLSSSLSFFSVSFLLSFLPPLLCPLRLFPARERIIFVSSGYGHSMQLPSGGLACSTGAARGRLIVKRGNAGKLVTV